MKLSLCILNLLLLSASGYCQTPFVLFEGDEERAAQSINDNFQDIDDRKFDVDGGSITGYAYISSATINNDLSVTGSVVNSSGTKSGWFEVTGSSETPPIANRLYKKNIIGGWVNFDGGTMVSTDSFNVSSLDDLGVGHYRVNWDRDFSTINYAVVATGVSITTAYDMMCSASAYAVGSVVVRCFDAAAAATDATTLSVIAIGSQ